MSTEDSLQHAIELLREELTNAIEEGYKESARVRFRVAEPVVLELQAVVTKVGEGKVGWKIVEAGGSYTSANTHKITLKLMPEWWNGEEYSPDFRISATLPGSASPSQHAGPPAGLDESVVGDAGRGVDPSGTTRLEEGIEDA